MKGTVFRIERFAIHDGPGIRTTVFLKGCPLRCQWCHSPESQSPDPEFMPLADRCLGCGACLGACPEHAIVRTLAENETDVRKGVRPLEGEGLKVGRCRLCGTCVAACPTGARVLAGEQMSVRSVIDIVERDHIFYDESGGGVTFSGGEPLMQPVFVAALIEECRGRGIHTAVDTSGLGDPEALDAIRPDLFLFDVKAVDDTLHRAITGVSNRVILANLVRLAARTVGAARGGHLTSPTRPTSLIVRLPLVPGLTDTDENVDAVGRLVSSLGIARIDVLPYHRAGIAKYERLGLPYPLGDMQPPTAERVQLVVEMLGGHGLTAKVGG